MNKEMFLKTVYSIFESSTENYIPAQKALSPELISVKIFDTPIIKIASSNNIMFEELKNESIIGEHFVTPKEWLENSKSVISIYLPFTKEICESNKNNNFYPSNGWLNGRIEGQEFINNFTFKIVEFLNTNNYKSIYPAKEKYFASNSETNKKISNKTFTSNWSERHVAYICGIGTFGLAKGIITEKGSAGRLTSIITELEMPAEEFVLKDIYDNCSMCGKCIKNCPAGAISLENGKNHDRCNDFLNSVLKDNPPYYGCGKCQVSVPCETRIPSKK